MVQRLETYLQRACFVILAYIPFHAFVSTWLTSNFGGELLWKVLKDLLVSIVAVGSLVLLYKRKPKLSKTENSFALAVTLFVLLSIVSFVFYSEFKPAFAGLIIDIRFLLFFAAMFILARCSANSELFVKRSIQIALISFVAVVLFGVLQITVLPKDFLRHFGYSKAIIPAFSTVDNNQSIVRILSTLRGPNPLGAYLAGLAPIALAVCFKNWRTAKKYARYIFLFTLLFSAVLARTYSRSAVIGLAAAILILVVSIAPKWRNKIVIALTTLGVVLLSVILIFQHSLVIQSVVFHNDPHEGNSVNSDDQHISSLQSNFKAAIQKPLGHGIGSAGLASTYSSHPHIIENYFIQILFELGVLGTLLLVAIHYFVGMRLWQLRRNVYAMALLSSLIGLVLINMFWPAWADETLSLTWWGLAGAVIGATSLSKIKKRATVSGDGKAKA